MPAFLKLAIKVLAVTHDDLLHFCQSVIQRVTEFPRPVWQYGLTAAQYLNRLEPRLYIHIYDLKFAVYGVVEPE